MENRFDSAVEAAAEKYKALLYEQLQRSEDIKKVKDFTDYNKLDKLVIGVCGGDGIGPTITAASEKVLRKLLADDIAAFAADHPELRSLYIGWNDAITDLTPLVPLENLESVHGALLRMNRSIQAEGTFGILKQDRNYKRIVRRGLDFVKLELYLVSIGHNLFKFYNKTLRAQTAA